MNIIISGKHIDLSPSLKTYIREKVQRLTRYGFDIETVRVELDVDHHHRKGLVAKAHATVVTKAKDFHAEEVASEMHEAIDLLIPKIDKQIRRFKSKLSDTVRKEKKKRT